MIKNKTEADIPIDSPTDTPGAEEGSKPVPEKRENILINIGFNIIIPVLILTKLNGENALGPLNSIYVAISFPFFYGLYDLIQKKKWNFFSILGIANIGMTGALSLYQLETIWFAVKEASVPALFGIATLISLKTSTPLVRMVLLNPSLVNANLIEKRVAETNTKKKFDKIIVNSTFLLTISFIVSSILNFSLAVYLLKSPPGTSEFSSELGQMHAWSFPVIAVPSTIVMMIALWYLVSGIRKLTDLKLSEILHHYEE
ncbi:MAG: VC0807 family protein [Leptospirales bacterium]